MCKNVKQAAHIMGIVSVFEKGETDTNDTCMNECILRRKSVKKKIKIKRENNKKKKQNQ